MGKPNPVSQWAEFGASPVPASTRNVASNTAEDAATAEDAPIRMVVAHENVLLISSFDFHKCSVSLKSAVALYSIVKIMLD